MTRFLSRTSPGMPQRTAALTRPRADKRHRDRQVDVTNTATLTLSDLLHIVGGARNGLIQPLPAAGDGREQ